MTDWRIREARPEDLPALREIVRNGFGDSAETADLYLRDEEKVGIRTLAAEKDGRVVSTISLLPGITLRSGRGETASGVYLYALSTLPEARGQGIGMALYREAHRIGREMADVVCAAVMEDGMKKAYDRHVPLFLLGRTREAVFTRAEIGTDEAVSLNRVSPEEYARAREAFLQGRAHASYSPALWGLAGRFGTVFLRGKGVLAMAEIRDGQCMAGEMLTDGTYAGAAGALAAACPAETYQIRTPLDLAAEGMAREGTIREYALRGADGAFPAGEDCWYPLIMD